MTVGEIVKCIDALEIQHFGALFSIYGVKSIYKTLTQIKPSVELQFEEGRHRRRNQATTMLSIIWAPRMAV